MGSAEMLRVKLVEPTWRFSGMVRGAHLRFKKGEAFFGPAIPLDGRADGATIDLITRDGRLAALLMVEAEQVVVETKKRSIAIGDERLTEVPALLLACINQIVDAYISDF